jgi:hypothetical protein
MTQEYGWDSFSNNRHNALAKRRRSGGRKEASRGRNRTPPTSERKNWVPQNLDWVLAVANEVWHSCLLAESGGSGQQKWVGAVKTETDACAVDRFGGRVNPTARTVFPSTGDTNRTRAKKKDRAEIGPVPRPATRRAPEGKWRSKQSQLEQIHEIKASAQMERHAK